MAKPASPADPTEGDLSQGGAWMRGRFMPISEAALPVTDWAITRSDVTYDVCHVVDGKAFRLDDHLARFARSMEKRRMSVPESLEQMRALVLALVGKTGLRDAYVALVCSRGSPRIYGSRDPRDCENHFFAWAVPFINVIPKDVAARGAHLKVATTVRRIPDDSVDPTVKNYSWGDFTTGLFEALDAGYDTAILKNHADEITEGPGFNLFAVIGNQVISPNSGALEGITRESMLLCAAEAGYEAIVAPLSHQALLEADEVFTATTAGGPVPVTRVDKRTYGNDAPGPITEQLSRAYWQLHQRAEFTTEIDYEQ